MVDAERRYSHIPSTIYLVKSAEAANRLLTERIAREEGLTALQYTALGVLERRDGLTAAQLARRSFVTPQSMQDMVRALQDKGFVDRAQSPDNRRELRLSITAAGREVLRRLEPRMAELNDAVLGDFSAAEVEMFRALLLRARRNAAALL